MEQTSLPKKQCLHLQEVVGMLVYRTEWHPPCPLFKGFTIGTEPEVARKGSKQGIVPVPIVCFVPFGYLCRTHIEPFVQ